MLQGLCICKNIRISLYIYYHTGTTIQCIAMYHGTRSEVMYKEHVTTPSEITLRTVTLRTCAFVIVFVQLMSNHYFISCAKGLTFAYE